MAVSLLVSFTYGWGTYESLALMLGIFVKELSMAAHEARSFLISRELPALWQLGPPDGYPMALKGEAGKAMGIATTQSVIGTGTWYYCSGGGCSGSIKICSQLLFHGLSSSRGYGYDDGGKS